MNAVLHIAIAQFIFAGILVFTKRPRHVADRVLGFWMLLMALFMGMTLAKQEIPDTIFGKLQLYPFAFTFGPFILLYVKALVKELPEINWRDYFHFIPFAIFSIAAVTLDTRVDELILSGKSFQPEMLIYSLPVLISLVSYLSITLSMLSRHRENIHNHFSYESGQIKLTWLRILVISFTVTMVLTLFSTLSLIFVENQMPDLPGFFLFLGFTFFAFTVSFFGVRQPAIYKLKNVMDERFEDKLGDILLPEDQENEGDEGATKYARSSLTEEQAIEYSQALMQYMENGMPFLRRDLNIQDIADELDIPQHHLTQTINEYLNKNFYMLVNEYRVEEVKKRLLDQKYKHLTILAIAHDAGFNSKSSFNMIFKKHIGLTPSEYRRKHGMKV